MNKSNIEVRSHGKKLCEITPSGIIEIVDGGMLYRIDFLETIRSGKAQVDRRSSKNFTRINTQQK
jgi:hypothetical protein